MRHVFVAGWGLVLIASLCMPAAAQWKWRDKNNQVQYSDTPPPPGIPEANILQRPAAVNRRAVVVAPAASVAAQAAASAPGLPAPKAVEPELEAKLRKEEQEKAAKAKVEADKLAAQEADNCARARSQLRVIDEGLRIARVNDKGEREVLDDKGRAEESSRNRAIVAANCK